VRRFSFACVHRMVHCLRTGYRLSYAGHPGGPGSTRSERTG